MRCGRPKGAHVAEQGGVATTPTKRPSFKRRESWLASPAEGGGTAVTTPQSTPRKPPAAKRRESWLSPVAGSKAVAAAPLTR